MYVYLLESLSEPDQHYVGIASNLKKRLASHNAGQSKHTVKHKPLKVVAAIWFENEKKARAFEKYLKGGSGRVFG